jgi:hypothetical protein
MKKIDIRYLRKNDAQKLVECFEACYGDTYANEIFYNPELIGNMIGSGALKSVVAAVEGNIVGHTGLTIRTPDALVAEAGNTVVSPNMRGQGLLGQLGAALRERTLIEGYVGYIHYPTTAHDIMQKSATSGTGRETGIMQAYIPAETEYNKFDESQGRLSATVVYQPLMETPERVVYLPSHYDELVQLLTQRLGLQRKFKSPESQRDITSEILVTHSVKRDLTHIDITVIGNNLQQILDGALASSQRVVHIDITMTDPCIDVAVEQLISKGFMYCAWMPNFGQSDMLRMQRIQNLTSTERTPNLVTPEARQLLNLINQEHDQSR